MRNALFWSVIGVLVTILLLMMGPWFETVGLIAMFIALEFRVLPLWLLALAFLWLAMAATPLIWVGRLLIQASRSL